MANHLHACRDTSISATLAALPVLVEVVEGEVRFVPINVRECGSPRDTSKRLLHHSGWAGTYLFLTCMRSSSESPAVGDTAVLFCDDGSFGVLHMSGVAISGSASDEVPAPLQVDLRVGRKALHVGSPGWSIRFNRIESI